MVSSSAISLGAFWPLRVDRTAQRTGSVIVEMISGSDIGSPSAAGAATGRWGGLAGLDGAGAPLAGFWGVLAALAVGRGGATRWVTVTILPAGLGREGVGLVDCGFMV